MRITASKIESWAPTREAQGLLPVLIRRLINASSTTTALAVPGGDSIVAPGWDGYVEALTGNAWVPKGISVWEFGCGAEIGRKATVDFNKRTKQTPAKRAANSSFIFVTPRRWRQKAAWLQRARRKKHWRDVRAYDADDLEAWLESVGSVALWFGEQLGVVGNGIESLTASWNIWAQQTSLSLNADAFLNGRQNAKASLSEALSKQPQLIGIEADSSDEAVAFAAIVLESEGLGGGAACVTAEDGWRFCDANAGIRIGIAASPEIATRRAPRDGFTLIVPLSKADRRSQLAGSAAKAADNACVILERQRSESFEEALRMLGEEATDATRLSHATGRSWSVYRRLRARNLAIRQPRWLKGPASRALAAITLVGGWRSDRAGDRACLEAISGQTYEALEADLRHLARLDDAPVLLIGAVWKAKAPIDLLHLVGPELTSDQLGCFFTTAEAILKQPDPALELEENKRWAAAVYGKVREESGFVIDALVDSLAKLSVYAERIDGPQGHLISDGVGRLVRNLLHDGDGERWMSLAGVLRELAEAAPDEFLSAVEHSLGRADRPITRLITETANGGMGRCWHAGLLWAMEVLAWSPSRLARVCGCLAPLAHIPVKGNWSNTALNTVTSFFRAWWPQTAADVPQRIAVLDRLIAQDNAIGWQVLHDLVPRSLGGFAHANAKPRWRDDDAGTGNGVRSDDYGLMLSEIGARVLVQAKGHAERIAALVTVMDSFEGSYKDSLVELVESARDFDEQDREIVRASVRNYLNWHNSYNKKGDRRSRSAVSRLRKLFDELASQSAVRRHTWLFENDWVSLPDGRDEDFEKCARKRAALRKGALKEILEDRNLAGVAELVVLSGNPWLVGVQLARLRMKAEHLSAWMVDEFQKAGATFHQRLINGVLCGSQERRRSQLFDAALSRLAEAGPPTEIAALTSCLPFDQGVLSFLEGQPEAVQLAFWRNVRLGVLRSDEPGLSSAVEKLLAVERPRSAFDTAHIGLKRIPPHQIVRMLEGIRVGLEPEGPLPQGYNVGQAIAIAQQSGAIERRTLAAIEFAFYKALEHDRHGVPNLHAEILSDPALFLEFICLIYKRRNGPTEPVDESRAHVAETAWSVLHNGRGVPGSDGGQSVDAAVFGKWVTALRAGAREHDRAEVTDSTLGQWLSSCPSGEDGIWPCKPVRDLLEGDDAEDIRRGFALGIRNNRGMTSRMPDEGGGQERALAARYGGLASALRNTHPRLAHVVGRVSAHYTRDAQQEDLEAELSIEGH